MPDPLRDYQRKRDFARTSEPRGGRPSKKVPIFVIQEHDATAHHYDVRLESGGVLKSWAVPKGPSFDPRVRRLAVRTEDHPMDYATFEGVIPEGEYGGGPVIVWDYGVYQNLDKLPLDRGIEKGRIKVWLQGTKVMGGFTFTRFKEQGGKENWLLIKLEDEHAKPSYDPVHEMLRSVLTGRTIADVGAG